MHPSRHRAGRNFRPCSLDVQSVAVETGHHGTHLCSGSSRKQKKIRGRSRIHGKGPAVLRIGLIGTENSHITHFTRFLNVELRHEDARAVGLAGGRSPRNLELSELGGIDLIVEEPSELVDHVDAGIVSTRDGARHLEHSRPLLEAGMPVLVDKPLATSVADATELLDIAERSGAVLLSCSALRFVPEIADFPPTAATGRLRHLHVTGPADPDSEYSGLFFYGIHLVETALEILGNPELPPAGEDGAGLGLHLERHGDTVVASLRITDIQVTLTFLRPTDDGQAPFHVTAAYEKAVIARDLTLGGDYNAPALDEFLTATRTGSTQRTRAQLLAPVAVLAAIAARFEDDAR